MKKTQYSPIKNESYNQILTESVDNHLYLGDYVAANNLLFIRSKNIKTIITVAAEIQIDYESCYKINHVHLKIADNEKANILKYFQEANKIIAEGLKQGSVLVHCAAGVSRSATIVVAYIMETQSLNFQKAFMFVKMKRSVINPNRGFVNQLLLFEKQSLQISKQSQPVLNTLPRVPRQQQQINYYMNSQQKLNEQSQVEYGFFNPLSNRKASQFTPQKERPFYMSITKSFSSSRQNSGTKSQRR